MKKFLSKLYLPVGGTIIMQMLLCLPGNNFPASGIFNIPGFDKLVHLLMFGAFVGCWCYYFHLRITHQQKLSRVFFIVFLVAATNGIVIEYIQAHFIPFRSFDEWDIIADLIGASIAYGFSNVKLLTC